MMRGTVSRHGSGLPGNAGRARAEENATREGEQTAEAHAAFGRQEPAPARDCGSPSRWKNVTSSSGRACRLLVIGRNTTI
jgi:hypothetical protein